MEFISRSSCYYDIGVKCENIFLCGAPHFLKLLLWFWTGCHPPGWGNTRKWTHVYKKLFKVSPGITAEVATSHGFSKQVVMTLK